MTVLVTGGCGFIGSNFILDWIGYYNETIINLDKMSYSSNPRMTEKLCDSYFFENINISDYEAVKKIIDKYKPRAILNFAAETHVDRSIHSPDEFIQSNIIGTFNLLKCSLELWNNEYESMTDQFRFIQISTDEVYGSLDMEEPAFKETNKYYPNSPYSASKASSDHLVRSYHKTYNLPTIITNCSNNYGPYQYPEKLIPLIINNAIHGKSLPVYGDGMQIRDWLFVKDHCSALRVVLEKAAPGSVYNIGGNCEIANIDVVNNICSIIEEAENKQCKHLISFIKDRPGHDRRYAIDSSRIMTELGWSPKENFDSGLKKTIEWYLANQEWLNASTSGEYKEWVSKQYQ